LTRWRRWRRLLCGAGAAGLAILAACGSPGSPGNASSPGAPPCAPRPCGASNGATVTISDLDAWYAPKAVSFGVDGGPRFTWRIRNDTNATLTLDQSGIDPFDANHAEIRSSRDSMHTTAEGGFVPSGCMPRATMRIPPHQTVSAQRVCVETNGAAQAAVLEFALTSGPVDVALPPYGTVSDPCPPDSDIATAMKSWMGASAVQAHGRYCKGVVVAVVADVQFASQYATPAVAHPFLLLRGSDGTLRVNVTDPCRDSGVPSTIRQPLGC
jgi:hypothetical protein